MLILQARMKNIPSIVVTSALPYANGPIHIGHLVEYIQTDIYVRFLKLSGKNAIYCCADDTHGAPIEINATKLGIKPEQLIATYLKEHQEDFAKYNIAFDSYYTTNSEENRHFAELIYANLQKAGHIYEKELELTYCEHDKRFLPDRYVKGTCPKCAASDQYGDVCEKCNAAYTTIELIDPYCTICGNAPIRKTSNHLFFRLSGFAGFLEEWLTGNERLQPEIRNQVLGWVRSELDDWCISRDGPYFGFKIPGSDKYFYVWLDAPIGYIASLANYLDKDVTQAEKVWNTAEVQHFIGKDIIYFHLLFWPAVLHAAGFKTPDNLVVHGFLTVDGEKMSKSRGTFLTAKEFAQKVPDTEFLRFYYAGNLSHSMTDIDLNLRDFTERVNKEMVSNVANFLYRTQSFIEKNYSGSITTEANDARAKQLEEQLAALATRIIENYGRYEFRKVVQDILSYSQLGNQYFQEQAPWKDPAGSQSVLTTCANIALDLSILLSPILPGFCASIQEQLGVKGLTFADVGKSFENRKLNTPKILWTKMEQLTFAKSAATSSSTSKKKEEKTGFSHNKTEMGNDNERATKPKDANENSGERNPVASLSPAALDLIVAKITKVERHPQAEKLYIESIDDGSGVPRVIVSGLVPFYTEEELTGKHIILVNNLKPAKLRGVHSQGMLLAAQATIDGRGVVEVLEAPHAQSGERVVITGFSQNDISSNQTVTSNNQNAAINNQCVTINDQHGRTNDQSIAFNGPTARQITIEEFFSIPFEVKEHKVYVAGAALFVGGKQVTTKAVKDGDVR
jgi:methionyl-tRNA synthetase